MSHNYYRPFGPRAFFLASAILCLVLPSKAQQRFVPAPHKPVASPLPHSKAWHRPATPRSMAGGQWMIDPDMKSSLTLSNKVTSSQVTVTPSLYLSNGTRYVLPPVVLEPSGTAVISINQALADQGVAPYATLSGYVQLDYSWPWDPICATIHNIDPVHSLLYNYSVPLAAQPATESQEVSAATPKPNLLEGMWWRQEKDVSGFIALSNTTSQAINAILSTTDSQGILISRQDVTVSAHGAKTVELVELLHTVAKAGGVQISYTGPENGLLATGRLEDKAAGYSANLPVGPPPPSPGNSSSATVAELGLMVGAADPMLRFPAGTSFAPYSVMRNVSGRPVSVTPTLYWMTGGTANSAPLPPFTVPQNRTVALDVTSLLAQAGLKNFNGSVNLIVNVEGQSAHPLIMAAGSVDRKNTYVFAVTPSEVKERAGRALSYWSTAEGDDTMVTLWNAADEPQELAFTLFFSGGQYKLPVHLDPRATRMFNLSEVVENQIPDADGSVIPRSIHEGRAVLSGAQGRNEHILIASDAGTYNVKKATCGNYCVTCDGIVDAWIDADPFAVAMGGTNQLTLTVQDDFGDQYDATSYSSWRSSKTSVATVSHGLVTPVSAGSLVATGTDSEDQTYCHNCYFYPPSDCPCSGPVVVQTPGTVMANAQISLMTVAPATIGPTGSATITVQIYHDDTTGLSSPTVRCQIATYSTSPAGISVTYHSSPQTVSLNGTSPATATFTVDSPSGAGTVTIQATIDMPSTGITVVAPNPATNARTTLTTTN